MMEYNVGEGGHPDDIMYTEDQMYNDNDTYGEPPSGGKAGKGGKKAKKANEKAPKEKTPPKPIEPRYEGYIVNLCDPTTSENASWMKTKRTKLPFDSRELYEKAIKHQRQTNGSKMSHYLELNKNQQAIVDRLKEEINSKEKEANAEWVLFDVKKLYEQRSTRLTMYRTNHAMRVTFKRQDRLSDVIKPKIPVVYDNAEDIIDLSKPAKVAKAPTTKKKDGAKKKDSNKDQDNAGPYYADAQVYPDEPPGQGGWPDQQMPQQQQQQQQQQDYQSYPQDPQQYDQMYQDPPPGAIPVDQHFQQEPQIVPPWVPEVPQNQGMYGDQQQHQHQNPFTPQSHVFPGPHDLSPDLDPRRSREEQSIHARARTPLSARRRSPSASRHAHQREAEAAEEEAYQRQRRQSAENKENLRRLQDSMEEKFEGLADMVRVAASNSKVRDWHPQSPGLSSSSRSPRDDFWSSPNGSSGDRRNSTPGTSPDRDGGRYYSRARPSGSLHRDRDRDNRERHASPGPRYGGRSSHNKYDRGAPAQPHYYEREQVVRPHATYRQDRDRDRGRDHRYPAADDYPRQQQPRELPFRERERERPRIQRRVTDYPEGGHRYADFDRRADGRGADYTRVGGRARSRSRERERERQPVYVDDRYGGRRGQGGGYHN